MWSSDSIMEIAQSESRQKVTELGNSFILAKDRSTSLEAMTNPFISALGSVIPLREVTLAFERRRHALYASPSVKLQLNVSSGSDKLDSSVVTLGTQ